jgi:hypothetical protein
MTLMESDYGCAARHNGETFGKIDEASDEGFGEILDETREEAGWVTTKQAAKSLGVSRRMVQEYVRRGDLGAQVEGEGVSKTYYISIDSLNALRERRRQEAKETPASAVVSSSKWDKANLGEASHEAIGEVLRHMLERLEARTVEAADLRVRLELTAQAESTLREAVERECERADKLEAELGEARKSLSEPRGVLDTPTEVASEIDVSEPREAARRRSWFMRFFFGP